MEEGRPSRRAARVRAACLRCQKRKIRCDGSVPVCSACRKAGVPCKDDPGNGSTSGNSVRNYITSLQRRVRWLESTLTSRCPDVDLAAAPQLVGGPSVDPVTDVAITSEHEPCQDGRANPQKVDNEDQKTTGASHQIGLVALTPGVDSKYIGPSSGFFFARLVLAAVSRQGQQVTTDDHDEQKQLSSILTRDAFELAALPSLPKKEQAVRLSTLYFDTTHRQWPFLHRASHMTLIESVYASETHSHIDLFQLKMVLAIAATGLSRRFKGISGEGFAASAMEDFDQFASQDSLRGVQCLLLLLLYTLHSPSLGFNAWHINYQCLAAVLDLGLQRDVKATSPSSRLEQELRTRAFWVIYTLDRTLATIMGRPIGLRDEACDLRLPLDVNDNDLGDTTPQPSQKPTDMSYAIHLFKLASLNSEIKYILHSVSKDPPRFTYPSIPDPEAWQQDLLQRLQDWAATIPKEDTQLAAICEIRFHILRMALLRPTPRLPRPSQVSLQLCLESAIESLALYDTLYRSDGLQYTWMSVHSVFLTALTLLYCIWALPGVVKKTKPDVFVSSLKTASVVLSAIGEHWSEARRCREVLDDLATVTIRRVLELQGGHENAAAPIARQNVQEYAGPNVPDPTLPSFEDWSTAFFGDMGWANQMQAANDWFMQDFGVEGFYNVEEANMGFDTGHGF